MFLQEEKSLSLDIDDRGGTGHQIMLERENGEVTLITESNARITMPQHVWDALVVDY